MASRRNNGLLIVALAAIAFLFATGALAKGKKTMSLPSGPKTDPKKTGGADTGAWAKSRFAAALAEVKARGETDDANARAIALSVLTHWSIETGAGANEYNYNVGNITAYGSQSYYVLKDISGVMLPFRNFDSLADGVRAYFDLLHASRYSDAAAKLANNPEQTDWWIALGHAGWFDPTKAKPPSTWDQAAASFAARRANLAQYATVSGDDVDGDVFDVDGEENDE